MSSGHEAPEAPGEVADEQVGLSGFHGGFSRRDVISALVGRVSGRAAGSAAIASGAPASVALASDVASDLDPAALLPKLIRRVTYGVTPNDLTLAQTLGYSGYLEYQLNPGAIDDSLVAARLAGLTSLGLNFPALVLLSPYQVANELIDAVIVRAVSSRRQLFERMVELWTDHFNILLDNGDDRWLKIVDDREVIRAQALGTFPALLSASAHSPAMLYYLDNVSSVAGNPNENYARELLERHSMGVGGGYTQHDVEEIARCFTGWQVETTAGPTQGSFKFNAAQHDQGQKTVLGQVIAAGGGVQDGERVLQILGEHPSTARFIAGKICNWLLGEGTPPSVIDSVAATYQSTGGNIKSMIRTALRPSHLYDAPPRFKRPFHLFVSVLRALSITVGTTASFRNSLTSAGHRPFDWPTADGYPDNISHWVGGAINRWNFAMGVASGEFGGAGFHPSTVLAGTTTAETMAQRISDVLFGGEMDTADRLRVRDALLPDPPTITRQRDAIGLALSSPGFQWY